MFRSTRLPLVAIAFLAFAAALVPVGRSLAGPDAAGCGCTGAYVQPAVSSGAEPAAPASSSPNFQLSVFNGGLYVASQRGGARVLNLRLDGDFHAGFDPSGNRLAVWGVDANQQDFVQLYDLTSNTAQAPVWHSEGFTGALVLGFSGQGKYLLTLVQSSASAATAWVVNTATGNVAFQSQLPAGSGHVFSPDEDRFLVSSATSSVSHLGLFDLVAKRYSWQGDQAAGSVSGFFSPHGRYFGVAALTSGNHVDLKLLPAASAGPAANTPLISPSFNTTGVPGSGNETFGIAGWGFSPDDGDATFVYATTSGQSGASFSMVNLGKHLPVAQFSFPNLFAGSWQFSPCGDLLAIATQSGASSGWVAALYPTSYQGSDPAPAAQQPLPAGSLTFKATDAWHVATVNGTDYNLLHNTGCNGNSSGGSGGSSNGGGSQGNGGGPSGGGNGGGNVPCPACTTPPTISAFSLDSLVVASGQSVTGSITLTNAFPVVLISSNPQALKVPTSVYVTAGNTPQSFTATAGNVTQDEWVTIIATDGVSTKTVRIVVQAPCAGGGVAASRIARPNAPIAPGGGGPSGDRPRPNRLQSLTITPIALMTGDQATATVTWSDAAVRDVSITLTSSNPQAATVPASVTIARGQSSASVPVTTLPVQTTTPVTITASAPGATRTAEIVVLAPPAVTGVAFDPASVTGGQPATGTVTLSASSPDCNPLTVRLSGDNSAAATPPASLTIPPGATSAGFSLPTNTVQSDTTVNVIATLGTSSATGSLVVKAATPRFNDNLADAAALALPGLAAGDTNQATIEPAEPVLSGSCFVLSAHHLENSVWFRLTPSQSGMLTVSTANPGTNFDSVLALYADPGNVGVGGLATPLGCDNNGDGNGDPSLVALEHTGPGGPATPIWSSIMHVAVTAGQTYYLQLGGVGGAPFGHYVLTAEVNSAIPSPTLLGSLTLSAASTPSGTAVTATATLSAPAPAGGAIVALSSSGSAASVPASVVIPAGASSADFTIQTASGAADTATTITGSFEGRTRSASLTISAD